MAHQDTFSDVEAEWEVPTVTGVTGTDDYSADWVGIGLGNSAAYPLIQAGTEEDYLNGTTNYNAWWCVASPADYNCHNLDEDGYYIAPGDDVGAHVTFNATKPVFHVWDSSAGWNFQYTYQSGSQYGNDGHAEWIMERPVPAGKTDLPYLADASVTFTAAEAADTGGWHYLGSLNDVDLYMIDCSHIQQLAYPGAIASDGQSFSDYYEHHGDQNVCGP
jgi:hypothetical protein